MEFSIQLSQDGPLYILRDNMLQFSKVITFLFLKINFVLANCADPDKMLPIGHFGSSLFAKLHLHVWIQKV